MARGWYSQTVNPSRLTVKPRFFRDLRFLLVILVSTALAVVGADLYHSRSSTGLDEALRVHALSSMSESQLRQTVVSNHLLVYWAGPSKGSNYLLDTLEANVIVLTVLPHGQLVAQTRTSYPQFVTYILKNAFKAVLAGGSTSNAAGFINSDGNAVFFSSSDSKNIFIGLKGKDVEVQIFDPNAGVALEIAREPGRLVPIA